MHIYGKRSLGSKFFDFFNAIFLIFLSVITIYPFIFVLFASISDPVALMAHRGLLLKPLGFTMKGYVLSFRSPDLMDGYKVTAFLVIVGTFCNLVMTTIFAFVLARRNLMWSGLLTVMIIITMYFNGGMIPNFILIRSIGLYDSLWSLILPTMISTYLLIIMRTAIRGVPQELEESARLDGARELTVLIKIVVPIIVPTIAALGLFYAVGYWNSWATALIYIKTPEKYPLQMVLRSILIQNQQGTQMAGSGYSDTEGEAYRRLVKYAVIVISIVPIMLIYPFIQKYFTRGIMIGAIKG